MRIFLLVFLLLYGGINYYLFRKVHAAWSGTAWVTWTAAGLCAAMTIAPIFIRILEQHGAIGVARVLAFIGFIWMAIVFWFLFAGATGDLWNLGVKIASRWRPGASAWGLQPKAHVLAVAAFIALAVVWGRFEASHIRVKEVRIPTPKLSRSEGPVRIVQISDVHLSLLLGRRMLEKIVRLVESAGPDVLVSTGDLSDGTFVEVNHFGSVLRDVPARWGKFACLGNHERYAGEENSFAFHESAGLRILRGEAVKAGPVVIAGVDDPAFVPSITERRTQEKKTLDAAHSIDDGPIILLKHRPQVFDESLDRFELQLSGHTHGGQIFPFGIIVYAFNHVWPGLHKPPRGGYLYLSRGTGTWGPPLRLFAPPEVTLFVLEPA